MKAAAFSLVVLTLNAAGPRRVHQGWPTRSAAIAEKLKAEAPDVAAFQELWRAQDVQAFSAAAGLPNYVGDPGENGLGLAVMMRGWKTGRWLRSGFGGGYGALWVEAKDGTRAFDAYTARLEPGEGPAAARRLAQLFRLAEFIRAQSVGRPFVLLGDLGAASDDKQLETFLDLLEARDLCVAHGDEVCGRTSADKRADYILIPYSSRRPEPARTAFTEMSGGEDDADAPPRFGLSAKLDAGFLRLKTAAAPQGRAEALAAVESALEAARADAERRAAAAGWVPFWGTRRFLAARREADVLQAAVEDVRSAEARSAARTEPSPEG